jgi:predicted transcriptional regulator
MGKIKISLARRVEVFFTRHPEEELTGRDIAEKFGTEAHHVHWSLTQGVRNGMLARRSETRREEPGRPQAVYSAGPVLLEMIGLTIEACAPVANVQTPAGRL